MLYLKAKYTILLLVCIILSLVLPVVAQNDSKVIIGEPNFGKLFAALYRYYQSQSAGSISVQNNTDENLSAETNVTVAGYAEKPFIVSESLQAGKTTRVPLRIDFNLDKLPTTKGPLMLDAEVEICVYSDNEQIYQKQLQTKLELENLHRLPDEPPETIAVFIDASDKSVTDLTQSVRAKNLKDNLTKAQNLFELMQKKRIICVEKPANTVQYPKELLRAMVGSSYDCALLYAAMLENSDVPVALMVSDEYILILFQQSKQQINEQQKEFVLWNDKYWIPVDIRMLKATFSEAKTLGMQVYESLKQEGNGQIECLADKPLGPHSHPNWFTEEDKDKVVWYKLQHPEKSARQIAACLSESDILQISYHSVSDILKQRSLSDNFF